jgi:hypothetical protein
VYEQDHTQTFWGANYARLLSIKNRYDPARLMDCWQCGESRPSHAGAGPDADGARSRLGGPGERPVRVLSEDSVAAVKLIRSPGRIIGAGDVLRTKRAWSKRYPRF